MTEHHRVIIVGGGVAGASCLYHLAQRGVSDCLLLEQGGLANGSSGRSAAFIETQYLDEERIRLCAWSLALYEQFARQNGLRLAQIGKLLLGFTQRDVEAFDRSIAFQRTLGLSDSQVLDPRDVRRIAPALAVDDSVAALWGPRDGYTDPAQLCHIYAAGAEARGGAVLVSTQVSAIRVERNPRFVIDTDRGSYTADILVNSCGAWAAQLGALLGLAIPIAGYLRQVAVYELDGPDTQGLPIVVVPPEEETATTLYFRPDGGSRILAGLHSEVAADGRAQDPDAYRRAGDTAFKQDLATLVRARFRGRVDSRTVGGWSGLYPLSPDGELILGEVASVPGFFNALGLGGNGVQLSAAVGRIVADLVVDGESELAPSLDRYRLERFDTAQ